MTTNWPEAQHRMLRNARLAVSSPEAVYAELKQIAVDNPCDIAFHRFDEEALARRGNPLINLGLAAFGADYKVFQTLYAGGKSTADGDEDAKYKEALRVACLSNRHHFRFGPDQYPAICDIEATKSLIANWKSDELKALICNPSHFTDKILEDLFRHTGGFSEANDKEWRWLIAMSLDNDRPNIEHDFDSSTGPDLGHFRIQKAIFNLLETAPVDENWLSCLHSLLSKIEPFNVHLPDRINHVLKRWGALLPKAGSQPPEDGILTSLPLAAEFRCLISTRYCRISGKTQVGAFDSKDVALRAAYYAREELTVEQMRDADLRDDSVYLLAAMSNEFILRSPDRRAYFEKEQLFAHFGNHALAKMYVTMLQALKNRSSFQNADLWATASATSAGMDRQRLGASYEERALASASDFRRNVSSLMGYLMFFINATAMAFAAEEFGLKGELFVFSAQAIGLLIVYLHRKAFKSS